MQQLTTVINTLNSADTLKICLESVKNLGEIVVCDMHSDDNTLEISKQYTNQIFSHPKTGYVEPARNFAISKAQTDWILVLDSDEEVSPELSEKINEIIQKDFSHIYFPRKNIIFGKWMQHSGWWPDEKLRLFKKGSVTWDNAIHSEPKSTGIGFHFPVEENCAIIHHHYTSVSQWVIRMDRYSTIQAKELIEQNYQFDWRDLTKKPLSEFITRFFVWEGWKDGINGLALALMQSLSWVVVYMKVKEKQNVKEPVPEIFIQEVGEELDKSEEEIGFYLEKLGLQSQLKRWIQKVLP